MTLRRTQLATTDTSTHHSPSPLPLYKTQQIESLLKIPHHRTHRAYHHNLPPVTEFLVMNADRFSAQSASQAVTTDQAPLHSGSVLRAH